jgi:hypothetical protein
MAISWKRQQLKHEAKMYDRLRGDMAGLIVSISLIVLRAAGRDGLIPNRRSTRETLSRAIWTQAIKPYFIGAGDDPLIGAVPQSPYMRLIVDGIRGSIRIQAERQIAIIQKAAPEDVFKWLTGPRLRATVREIGGGDRRLDYDPFHLFVNPNGYRLSDNGWNTAIRSRAAIDNLLTYEIPRRTAAVDIATKLEPYLWPEAAQVRTLTPYGTDGSYWARRLARTEITAAAGRSTVNASLGNPYVDLLRWTLSGSHPEPDICDENAHGGPTSDGRYPKTDFPQYPAHPHELCTIVPEVTAMPAQVTAELRQVMASIPSDGERYLQREQLQGAFNLDWLIGALMMGYFVREVVGEEQAA